MPTITTYCDFCERNAHIYMNCPMLNRNSPDHRDMQVYPLYKDVVVIPKFCATLERTQRIIDLIDSKIKNLEGEKLIIEAVMSVQDLADLELALSQIDRDYYNVQFELGLRVRDCGFYPIRLEIRLNYDKISIEKIIAKMVNDRIYGQTRD